MNSFYPGMGRISKTFISICISMYFMYVFQIQKHFALIFCIKCLRLAEVLLHS